MSIALKITVDKAKSVCRGFDHYWSVMMDHEMRDMTFSVSDILAFSKLARRDDVADFVRRLEKAGIIYRVGVKEGTRTPIFKIVWRQTATPKVRRDGTVIEGVSKQRAMWNYMRTSAGSQSFTAHDIVVWASTDNSRINIESAKSYIALLAKAGYLIEMVKGTPGKLGIWRLAPHMNSGPMPPMILRTKVVFDQNRQEVVGPIVTEEVQP